MQNISYAPVFIVEKLKYFSGWKTYQIESALVLLALLAVTYFNQKNPIEYVGVLAVFFTFMHATIAEYMREAEAERMKREMTPDLVACHYKLPYYFYAKETCWFIYFFLLGAHAALVGVFIFLLYQPWRNLWRSYHPR